MDTLVKINPGGWGTKIKAGFPCNVLLRSSSQLQLNLRGELATILTDEHRAVLEHSSQKSRVIDGEVILLTSCAQAEMWGKSEANALFFLKKRKLNDKR